MAARRQAFRQADVARAVKGAVSAGLKVGRVEVDQDGRIVIVSGEETARPDTAFDEWRAKRDARPA